MAQVTTDIHKPRHFRESPGELRALIRIIAAICVLYYLLFASGIVDLSPDVNATLLGDETTSGVLAPQAGN